MSTNAASGHNQGRLGLRPDPVKRTKRRLGLRPDPVGTETQPTKILTRADGRNQRQPEIRMSWRRYWLKTGFRGARLGYSNRVPCSLDYCMAEIVPRALMFAHFIACSVRRFGPLG